MNNNILIVLLGDKGSIFDNKLKNEFNVSFVGDPQEIQKIINFFDKNFKNNTSRLCWYYASKEGIDSVTLYIPDIFPIHKEYYPWIEQDPKSYFKDYLNSNCPILFLSGEPGVGKTSLIRNMIAEFNLNTFVGYDQKLFETDEMFIDFITSNTYDLMVLEDAETLVFPRKTGENTLISRLLNVSEGIVKLPHKKIIFTTNSSGFHNIDEALLRPGRCFDSLEGRALNYNEAIFAAKKANVNIPTEKRDYTLAELFNQTRQIKKTKIGFNI